MRGAYSILFYSGGVNHSWSTRTRHYDDHYVTCIVHIHNCICEITHSRLSDVIMHGIIIAAVTLGLLACSALSIRPAKSMSVGLRVIGYQLC